MQKLHINPKQLKKVRKDRLGIDSGILKMGGKSLLAERLLTKIGA